MNKKRILLFYFLTLSLLLFSQAGTGVYKFLDLPVSSRLAAMGGTNVSVRDNDINFAFQNPSLLTAEANNTIGLNIANYLADITFGSASYSRSVGANNFIAIGVQYVDYGKFLYTNEDNTQVGENYFSAKDMALSLIYARNLNDKFSVGATLKPIYSAYGVGLQQVDPNSGAYTSFGLAMDLGLNYSDVKNLFSAGLVFRNMGTQFKGYYSDESGQHYEILPFDIQLGISKKFEHAPLRLSLTLHNLQRFDLAYESTNQPVNSITGAVQKEKASFVEMGLRHSIWSVEFLPTKNFYLSASFNVRRDQEMSVNTFKYMSGFSFGGGLKLYKFHAGFGVSRFQYGNAAYQFSITTNLNDFKL